MSKFRPCIDIHDGQVKQIVGSTLSDSESEPKENFVSPNDASWFAQKYREDNLLGGHVIMLGPGNQEAAELALKAYPNGLQIGGGIRLDNATEWLNKGAEKVIVTSWLFDSNGVFQFDRLDSISKEIGREHLVVDLSCKRTPEGWTVAMNRWQTLTNIQITHKNLDAIAESCSEFLIHAADVEGKCEGIDADLVQHLSNWSPFPMTYAGGISNFDDIETIKDTSNGQIDFTVGSALDLFGGNNLRYEEMLIWNQKH